jgi:predicted lactoylglutathione lyase
MKFSTVALGVGDLDRSLEFYLSGLGFEVESRPREDLPYLATGETRIALYPASKLADYAGVPTLEPGGVVLSLNVGSAADVDAVVARCTDHRGTGLRAPGRMDWGGYAGTVRDPDGYVWEIVCANENAHG